MNTRVRRSNTAVSGSRPAVTDHGQVVPVPKW